ncbi:hypothetical protein B0H11DRAFT_1922396 [Mycena galericulata]|nr:hypothetical protein B0H11DRAFT_1922396 [Mycena galericulata]
MKQYFCGGGVQNFNLRARADSKSRARPAQVCGAELAERAKHVDGIKLPNSRAGTPKKANLRGGVKSLRGGNKSVSEPPYEKEFGKRVWRAKRAEECLPDLVI